MSKLNSFRFLASIFLTIGLLQFFPQIISPNYLFFNNSFLFGAINSNNLAIIFTVFLLIVLVFFITRTTIIFEKIALGMIIAGTVSNILDRIFRGGAVDYISIWIWPTFNLSDIIIVTGIIALTYGRLIKMRK